jgi:hypothetical protein
LVVSRLFQIKNISMSNALAHYNESGDSEMPLLKPGEINHLEMCLSIKKT